MRLTALARLIISMPKILYFNFKVFPFKQAIKLPVLVSYNVKVPNLHKDCIIINYPITRFMIRINWSKGSQGVNIGYKEKGCFDVKGKVIFNGKASFSKGISIRVDNGAELTFGENFSCNRHCFFSCNKKISFGNNVLLGWNINVRDSDGHNIYSKSHPEVIMNNPESVIISDNVWLAANIDILKGSEIPEKSIVGYNSCVSGKFEQSNCIIAGYPAKEIKKEVTWVK